MIPRPETEILVDYVNNHFSSPIKVLDAGTGSGCIGISIALKNTSIELPDKSIFNMFDSKGAFTDNQGNIGDFFGQGVRKTNNKGILIDVNALVIFKIDNKSSMWGFPTRVESDLEVGAGYFDVFSASGNLKELLGKRCQYGLNVTKEKSFVMQGFCK